MRYEKDLGVIFDQNCTLEPVCCKKRQKMVNDQLLVYGVGDL